MLYGDYIFFLVFPVVAGLIHYSVRHDTVIRVPTSTLSDYSHDGRGSLFDRYPVASHS